MTAPTAEVTETLVAFGRVLRACGVEAGPDRVQTFVRAVDALDVTHRDDVFWAGRLTLCAGPDDLPRYDRAFAAHFSGERAGPIRRRPPMVVVRPTAQPTRPGDDGAGERSEEAARAATASRVEILRHRDVARLSDAERDHVRRLLALLEPAGPTRLTRRHRPASRGPLDARRTVREVLRHGGEPARLVHVRRSTRPRRLVLLVDVSGSMAPYADTMLRFAHAAARRRTGTEVFTLGTRLTRVSREIRRPDPDTALAAVAGAVPDWSGGTRLGELMRAFLDRWGQRGTARGAVVVVISDGWERGDPTLLGEQMRRLHRLAHRVVWVDPHRGKPGYAPATAGLLAALPHCDDVVDGHSFDALARLGALLSTPGRGRA